MNAAAPTPSTSAPANEKNVIVDCSHTRYHVVRAAAQTLGWVVNDVDAEETVPASFYGVPLSSSADEALAHQPQVIWSDKSVLAARVAALQCYQRLNHFAAMHVIARKAVLFRRLMQLCRLALKSQPAGSADAARNPSSFSSSTDFPLYRFFAHSIPQSFSSLGDLARLEAFQRQLASDSDSTDSPFFIIKPNTGCEGRGIRLTTTPLSDLTEAERTDKKRECIIQLYVDRPLLMDGKKFDLRLYVLLVSVTPAQPPRRSARSAQDADSSAATPTAESTAASSLSNADLTEVPPEVEGVRLYIHREGLVRICAEPYAAPTAANSADALLHLTNYAVNKKSDLFQPAHTHDTAVTGGSTTGDAVGSLGDDGNKRSLAALASYIDGLAVPGGWAAVRRRIDACVVLTILSGVEALRREMVGAGGARGDRADGRGCFELLGFDVLLREATLEPVLMEVNHSPSLFCDTAFDFAVKKTVLRDTFRLLETHLPPWAAFEGNAKRYAACTSPGGSGAQKMAKAEASLLSNAEMPCGFRSLLPHYGGGDADADVRDWQPDERAAQAFMVKMSKQLR